MEWSAFIFDTDLIKWLIFLWFLEWVYRLSCFFIASASLLKLFKFFFLLSIFSVSNILKFISFSFILPVKFIKLSVAAMLWTFSSTTPNISYAFMLIKVSYSEFSQCLFLDFIPIFRDFALIRPSFFTTIPNFKFAFHTILQSFMIIRSINFPTLLTDFWVPNFIKLLSLPDPPVKHTFPYLLSWSIQTIVSVPQVLTHTAKFIE
jgi:hypothetical protein